MNKDVRGIRGRSREIIPKIHSLLTDNATLRAKDLAKGCHATVAQVYQAVRLMREDSTGVMPVKGGYVLSKYATKKQDVEFMRRMNGRRTSDTISVLAAKPDIKKRWKTFEDRRAFLSITGPLTPNLKTLESGTDILLKYSGKMGL